MQSLALFAPWFQDRSQLMLHVFRVLFNEGSGDTPVKNLVFIAGTLLDPAAAEATTIISKHTNEIGSSINEEGRDDDDDEPGNHQHPYLKVGRRQFASAPQTHGDRSVTGYGSLAVNGDGDDNKSSQRSDHRRTLLVEGDNALRNPWLESASLDSFMRYMGQPSSLLQGGLGVDDETGMEEEGEGLQETTRARMRDSHEVIASEQGAVLDEWFDVLHKEVHPEEGFNMMLYGADLGLLSLKLAKTHPKSLFYWMTPTAGLASAHNELSSLLELPNSLVGVAELTPTIISSLSHFTYQALSAEALRSLLTQDVNGISSCDLPLLEKLLGRVLVSAPTSFLEMPTFRVWLSALEVLLPSCGELFRQRYGHENPSMPELDILQSALKAAGVAQADVKVLQSSPSMLILRVDKSVPRFSSPSPYGGLPLNTLLRLGLADADRTKMARLFLRMPLWWLAPSHANVDASDVTYYGYPPSADHVHLFYGVQLLRTQNVRSGLLLWEIPGLSGVMRGLGAVGEGDEGVEAEEADALWSVLGQELGSHKAELQEGLFSFMEMGSGRGLFSMQVAKAFPNATIISVETSSTKTAAHYRMLKRHRLWNNLVCNSSLGLTDTLAKHLYESPELLRFLLLRRDVLSLLADEDPSLAGKALGMITSSSITTFLRVPTAQHVSLTMALFSRRDRGFTSPYSLQLSSHPLPFFKHFASHLLYEALVVPLGYTKISTTGLTISDEEEQVRTPPQLFQNLLLKENEMAF